MIRKGGDLMKQYSINQNYYVGAYERLSREDDRKEESSSIESQNMIVEFKSFAFCIMQRIFCCRMLFFMNSDIFQI